MRAVSAGVASQSLAVSALRRTIVHSVWRARRHDTAQSCRLAAVRRADGLASDITASSESCAAVLCGSPATATCAPVPPRGGHQCTDFSDYDKPRSPAGRLPRRAGPWRCSRGPATVPRRERARCAPALRHRRGATHPSSQRPPGPRAVAHGAFRAPTSHLNPGAATELQVLKLAKVIAAYATAACRDAGLHHPSVLQATCTADDPCAQIQHA